MEEVDAFGDTFCSVSGCSDVVLIIGLLLPQEPWCPRRAGRRHAGQNASGFRDRHSRGKGPSCDEGLG